MENLRYIAPVNMTAMLPIVLPLVGNFERRAGRTAIAPVLKTGARKGLGVVLIAFWPVF